MLSYFDEMCSHIPAEARDAICARISADMQELRAPLVQLAAIDELVGYARCSFNKGNGPVLRQVDRLRELVAADSTLPAISDMRYEKVNCTADSTDALLAGCCGHTA